jgi:hypothetical protein
LGPAGAAWPAEGQGQREDNDRDGRSGHEHLIIHA